MSDDDFDRVIAQLRVIERVCNDLGSTTSMQIDLDDFSQAKAAWLERTERPFFAITPEMAARVERAMSDYAARVFDSAEGTATSAELFYVGGEAAREGILERFSVQGGDVTLAALSPSWLRHKQKHGFPLLIGVYKNGLRSAVTTARIRFVMV